MSVQQAVSANHPSTFKLNMPPLADTIRISVAVLQPKDTCLSSLIGAGRTISSYNACQTDARHVRLTAQSADCVRLNAISTAAGSQDTLCIQHCNRNGTDCKTFVLIAEVAGGSLNCDIAPDTLMRIQLPDCQNQARFCIPGSNILDEFRRNYTVTHNGLPYSGALDGCSFDTIYSYTYFTIAGMLHEPPYRLDSWMFNGVNHRMDSVNSIFELVDSMNQWDPRSLWTLDTASLSIIGGYPGNAGMYGELRITKLSNGASGVMRVNTSQVSNGVSLSFAPGQHTIIFTNNLSNCSDTLRMGVGCPGLLPIAVDDSVVTQRNTPITFNLLSNDMLNGTLARPPGVITLSTTGTITISLTPTSADVTYLPRTGFCGTEVFEYQICNSEGCDTAKVTIHVLCDSTGNQKPIARQDTAQTRQNNSLIIHVLQNDFLNGNLSEPLEIITATRHGNAIVNDNSIRFTPSRNFCGVDTLQYKICNVHGCDSAMAFITVICDSIIDTRKPIAVNDVLFGHRNTTWDINPLRNDSLFGRLDSFQIVTNPIRGQAFINNNNLISYTTATDFCGNDTLSYRICNEFGCDTAMIQIVITCDTIRDLRKPEAMNDSVTVRQNNSLTFNALWNDSIYIRLNAFNFIQGGAAKHGRAIMDNQHQITYTPALDYCGLDTLIYKICNDNGCDTAMICITVLCDTIVLNRKPNAENDNVAVNRNNSLEINALRNDSLYGVLTTFAILDTARHGRAVVANERIFYTPTTNYCGKDTLRYQVCTSKGCDSAFIYISVLCDTVINNRRPNAVNDAITTTRNNSLIINVLQNDSLYGTLTDLAILDSTQRGNLTILNNQIQYAPLNGFCGNDTFIYKVCNATGCDTANVFITVTCDTILNRRPDANDDFVTVQRNTPLQINPLQNDSLYGVNTLFGVVQTPVSGRIFVDSTQIFYAPLAEYCGFDTIQYFVCNLNGCDTATIFIHVNCDTVRLVPEANQDVVTTTRNTLLTINALSNDITHGALTSTLRVPELPKHGTIVVRANNNIDYTPILGYCGKDTLRYEICNAAGCDTAFVFITVTCDTVTNPLLPIANPDFGFGVRYNPLSINILRNDTIRGSQDSLLLTQSPRHGIATIRFNNMLVYTPDSTFCGQDTMIYKLCNAFGCDTARVVATIECDTTMPCTIAPIATVDGINMNQRQSTQIFVLLNDSLKNCLLDSFYILTPARQGSASADAVDKVIQYTPLPDYCGKDSLVYKICNASGCDTAIVYIHIGCDTVINNNLLPIANRDEVYGVRGIPLAIMVLRNDSTNGRVTLTLDRRASAGETQVLFGTHLQYTPNNLFCGTDTITYSICNTHGCDTGLVVIHITCDTTAACSVPPVAYWDTVSTVKNRLVTILVIANDSLKNCRPDSLVLVQRPAHGIATTDFLAQTIKYQPDTNYCGTDTLIYRLCNPTGCDTALVIIQVKCEEILPRPIALRDDIIGFRDSTLTIYVTRNDTLNGALDSLSITQFPTHGQASVAGVDFITYQPNAGFCGSDTLIYKICNPNGCDTALVVINISCDTTTPCTVPPIANFDTISTLKGVTATIRVMANDSLRNCTADVLRIDVHPLHGRATADIATQSIVYQPDTNYCGTDTLLYTLCNRVSCDTAMVVITVICPLDSNQAFPIAVRDEASGIFNTSVPINVLRNDTINGVLDSLVIAIAPLHGRATPSIVTNAIYYQPDAAFCGIDSFTYKICNQFGCDEAIVVINIACDSTAPCTEPPVALDDAARTPVNRAVEIRVVANDSLKNCPLDSLTITKRPLHGIVEVDSIDKVVTYEPLPNYCGSDTFRYQLCNQLGCDTATVIVVTSCDTVGLPIANHDTLVVKKDSTLIFSALANDSINGVFVSQRIIKDPGHGIATITSDGQISYRPATSYCGKDSLIYELCNATGCDTAKVLFRVSCGDTIVIYTAISPNQDGKNDFLVLEGIEDYPNHEVRIFNRWGTEVFFTKSYRNHYSGGFEGQWNGRDLPDGVYFIRIDNGKTGEEHRIITKYFMIKR
jgi:large repetitive protein